MRRVGVIMTGAFQEALAVLKTSPEELTAEGQALMQGGDRPTGQRFLNTANAFDAGPALEDRLVQGQGVNAARAMNQLVDSNDNKEELANYARLLYDEGRESPDYHEARDNPDYRGKDELQAFYEAMSKLHHGKERVAGMNEAAESQLSQLRADDPSQFWADQRVRTGEPMTDAWSSLLKEELPHVTWMSPEKITGWVNGHLMVSGLPAWAANNPHTESISGQEESLPPPSEQGQFEQSMFDDEGKLKGEPMTDAWSSLLKELSGDEPYSTPTCLTCGRDFATPEDLEYHYSISGHAPSPYEKPSDDDTNDWSKYDPNQNQGEY